MSAESIVPESSPPLIPRHWKFAAALAWEAGQLLLSYGGASDTAIALLLQQLVADFLADPLIQGNLQQRTIWTLLRDRINANLADELRDPPLSEPL
jgi:hypothetical protein